MNFVKDFHVEVRFCVRESSLIYFLSWWQMQMFDRKYVEAILQEWFKTISDLPAGIKQAVELVR